MKASAGGLSVSAIRHKINEHLRPPIDDFLIYLNELVDENNHIIIIKIVGSVNYYGLKT